MRRKQQARLHALYGSSSESESESESERNERDVVGHGRQCGGSSTAQSDRHSQENPKVRGAHGQQHARQFGRQQRQGRDATGRASGESARALGCRQCASDGDSDNDSDSERFLAFHEARKALRTRKQATARKNTRSSTSRGNRGSRSSRSSHNPSNDTASKRAKLIPKGHATDRTHKPMTVNSRKTVASNRSSSNSGSASDDDDDDDDDDDNQVSGGASTLRRAQQQRRYVAAVTQDARPSLPAHMKQLEHTEPFQIWRPAAAASESQAEGAWGEVQRRVLEIPGAMNQYLRAYQREGAASMAQWLLSGHGGVLADDMV